MADVRSEILGLIRDIRPFDTLEAEHAKDAIQWIESGNEIFRIKKPDMPDKHLVSYICMLDKRERKILLVEHRKAKLWLPAGGHVDPGEHPTVTAGRECLEELKIDAKFLFEHPIFITSTLTAYSGEAGQSFRRKPDTLTFLIGA